MSQWRKDLHRVIRVRLARIFRWNSALNGIDLIIRDIGQPDGNGLDLMRQVVARRVRVPAIALKGYGIEEEIRRSQEAAFTALLTKPIDFAKLEAMIRQLAPVECWSRLSVKPGLHRS